MPTIRYKDQALTQAPGETVLASLLRAGVPVPCSCRAGACQACLVRAVEGVPPAEAQKGLKDTLRARGYFLCCIARPESDLTVSLSDGDELRCAARVHSLDPLSPQVLRLRLCPESDFPYTAGQFLNLVRPDGLTRSYSLASLPGRDPYLELHIRIYPGGQMGSFVQTLKKGELVHLRGPAGECFYVEGRPEQPILFAGTGTGLAPLYGILQDALQRGHRGPLALFHGAGSSAGLYLGEELRALAAAHPSVVYTPCALQLTTPEAGPPPPAGLTEGSVDTLIAARYPSLRGWRVFLCGPPALVRKLRRQVFLAGVSSKDISTDAFLVAPPPSAPGLAPPAP